MINSPSGIVLINKPSGITSFQALYPIKRQLKGVKVGHTGTLDKFASGLLVVMVGKMTRLASLVTDMQKRYHAIACNGIETNTLDPEGEIINQTKPLTYNDLESKRSQFVGRISQHPPLFSALKVKGKRASTRMRKGESVKLKARDLTIYNLELIDCQPESFTFSLTCSKGTYVRALARDWALSAGGCSSLKELERTQIGAFKLSNAVSPQSFDLERDILSGKDSFNCFERVKLIDVKEEALVNLKVGAPLSVDLLQEKPRRGINILFHQNKLIAALDFDGEKLSYLFNGGIS